MLAGTVLILSLISYSLALRCFPLVYRSVGIQTTVPVGALSSTKLINYQRNVDHYEDEKSFNLYFPPNYLTDIVDGAEKNTINAAELAITAGVHASVANRDLLDFARATRASMKVSEQGTIDFIIPNQYKSVLLQRSLRVRLSSMWDTVSSPIMTCVRTGFGVSLVIVLVVISSVLCSMSCDDNSEDKNNDKNGSSRSHGCRRPLNVYNFNYSFNNFLGYSGSSRNDCTQQHDNEKLPFLTSVYSYVFGDGCYSTDSEYKKQLNKLAAAVINREGGVVLAEELVPFLFNPPPPPQDGKCGFIGLQEESYVLPLICLLEGEPVVTDNGNILYYFKGTNDVKIKFSPVKDRELFQKMGYFSKASSVVVFVVAILGLLALLGTAVVTALAAKLNKPINATLLKMLWGYTLAFNALPAFRAIKLFITNKQIHKRNLFRAQWVNMLKSPEKYSPEFKNKLSDRGRWRETFYKQNSK